MGSCKFVAKKHSAMVTSQNKPQQGLNKAVQAQHHATLMHIFTVALVAAACLITLPSFARASEATDNQNASIVASTIEQNASNSQSASNKISASTPQVASTQSDASTVTKERMLATKQTQTANVQQKSSSGYASTNNQNSTTTSEAQISSSEVVSSSEESTSEGQNSSNNNSSEGEEAGEGDDDPASTSEVVSNSDAVTNESASNPAAVNNDGASATEVVASNSNQTASTQTEDASNSNSDKSTEDTARAAQDASSSISTGSTSVEVSKDTQSKDSLTSGKTAVDTSKTTAASTSKTLDASTIATATASTISPASVKPSAATITVHWQNKGYSLFNTDGSYLGGSGVEDYTTTISGAEVPYLLYRYGYALQGFAGDPNATPADADIPLTDFDSYDADTIYADGDGFTDIYAIWGDDGCFFIFMDKNGKVAGDQVRYAFNENVTIPAAPVEKGLSQWSTLMDGNVYPTKDQAMGHIFDNVYNYKALSGVKTIPGGTSMTPAQIFGDELIKGQKWVHIVGLYVWATQPNTATTYQYTITYNANGSGATLSGSATQTVGPSSSTPISATLQAAPTRAGYTFKGWAETSTAASGAAANSSYSVSKDITLYAIWEQNAPTTYTRRITYNAGTNGTFTGTNPQTITGTSSTVTGNVSSTLPTTTDSTKEFGGWSGSDGRTYQAGAAISLSSDVTLTAIWNTKADAYKYTIHYSADNGVTNIPADQVVSGSSSPVTAKISTQVPVKTGYTFKGWQYGGTTLQPGATAQFTQNTTLTAVWEQSSFTVTYNLDGGSTTSAKTTFTGLSKGTATPKITDPTKSGYTFSGWSPSVAATVTADVTYTAQWTAKPTATSVTIHWQNKGYSLFNTDGSYLGGSGVEDYTTTISGAEVPYLLYRYGYALQGFAGNPNATPADADIPLTDFDQYDANTILADGDGFTDIYAIWGDDGCFFIFMDKSGKVAGDQVRHPFDENVTIPAYPKGFDQWSTLMDGKVYPTKDEAQGHIFDNVYNYKALPGVKTIPGNTSMTPAQIFGDELIKGQKWVHIVGLYVWATHSENSGITVTFHPGFGTDDATTQKQQSMFSGVETTLNMNPYTRPGYRFAGWATTLNGSKVYDQQERVTLTANTDLYALWTERNDYKVIYSAEGNVSGGTFGTANTSERKGLKFSDVIAITAPAGAPTLNGYTFTGYNLIKAGTGTALNGSQTYAALAALLSQNDPDSITVYAQWSAKSKWTVNYSLNTSTSSELSGAVPSSQTVTDGDSITADAATGFSRTGYTFKEWNTNANGTGTSVAKSASYTPTGNVTLYAIWTADQRTIQFDKNANDATGSTPSMVSNTGLTIPKLNKNGFTRPGYSFAGWTTSQINSGTVYADEATNFVVPSTASSTITLYAQWTPRSDYKVSFNANGGNGTSEKTGLSWNTSAFIPGATNNTNNSAPTRSNYTFKEWNTKKDGTGTQVTAATIYSALDQDATADKTTNAGYITVYAIWQEEMVEIQYIVGSTGITGLNIQLGNTAKTQGTSVSETVGVVSGKHADGTAAYGALPIIPAGYEFSKWTTDGGGTTNAPNAAIDSATHKLTPQAASNLLTRTYYLWVTPKNIGYTVQYYLEQIDGSYTMDNGFTQSGTAAMGKTVADNGTGSVSTVDYSKLMTKAGYSVDFGNSNAVRKITIGADASKNIIKIYYNLLTYTIAYSWGPNYPTTAVLPTMPNTGKPGQTITLPKVTAPYGYTFTGWTGTNQSDKSTITISNDTFTMPAANATFVGNWKKIDYTVTYDAADTNKGTISENGGSDVKTITETVSYNNKPTKNITVKAKNASNWYFVNWTYSMDVNGDGQISADETNLSTTDPKTVAITSNVTFTANWQAAMTIAYAPGDHGAWKVTDETTTGLTTSSPIPGLKAEHGTTSAPKGETGYRFLGWTWQNAAGTKYATYTLTGHTTATLPTGNVTESFTFTAMWEPQQNNLIYSHVDETGTEFVPPATWATGTDPVFKHRTGDTVDLTEAGTITRPGHTLTGWKVKGDTSGTVYTTTFTMPGTETTLVPVWKENTVTINYTVDSSAHGTVNPTTETINAATGTAAGSTATAAKGYEFKGWKLTSAAGTNVAADWVTGTKITPKKNAQGIYDAATYVAVFAPINYTVTYVDGDHGTITAPTGKKETVAYGSKPTGATVAAADGYVLDGWTYSYVDEHGTTQTGTSHNTALPTTITIYDNATFTAIYKAASGYTVEFDSKGGSAVSALTNLTFDAKPINTPTPTRAGYTFGGWYWTSAITSGTDVTADMTFATVFGKNDSVKSGRKLTLFAKWVEKNNYTVVYNTNGGTPSIPNLQNVSWTQKGLLPSTNPTLAGKKFLGWFTQDGTTAVTNDISYATLAVNDTVMSVTLYAHWDDKTYTLKYDTDGGDALADKQGVKWSDTGLTLTPTKQGYTFVKWVSYGADHTTITNNEVTATTPFSDVAANDPNVTTATIKAIWAQDGSYVVEYYIVSNNGQTVTQQSKTSPVSAKVGVVIDGTNATPNPQNTDYRQKLIPGYGFSAGDPRNVLQVTIASGSTVAIKLYYVENAFYTVGYDLNGGTAPTGTSYADKTGVAWTQKGLIPATNPVKDGYTFTGWAYTPEGGTQTIAVYGTDDPTYGQIAGDAASASTAKRVLVAQWKSATVTITYVADPTAAGNVSLSSESVDALTGKHSDGSGLYGATPTPNAGYKFVGWTYTDATGTHDVDPTWIDAATHKLVPQADNGIFHSRTYVAKFADLSTTTYKIEHYKQQLDGTYSTTPSDVDTISGVKENDEVDANGKQKTYTGFTFNPSIKGTKLTGTVAIDALGNPTLVLKLYYTRNAHKVTYAYGNTVAGAPQLPATQNNVLFDAKVNVAEVPTLTHYTFKGWTVTTASGSVQVTSNSFNMPDEDVTITGIWEQVKYDVTFASADTNQGTVSGSGQTQQVPYQGKASMDNVTTAPTAGYYLSGWTYTMDTDGDGVADVTGQSTADPASVVILGKTTFTAHWAKSFAVTYLRGAHGTFTEHSAGKTEFSDLKANAAFPSYAGETSTGSDALGETGFKFLGWMWEVNGVKHYTYADTTAGITAETLPANVDQNYVLTAMWEGLPYKVIFHATDTNGAAFDPAAVWGTGVNVTGSNTVEETHKATTTVTLYGAGAITRAGYTLTGWTTNGTDFYGAGSTNFVMPTHDVNFYPVWEFNSVKIIYTVNDPKMGGVNNTSDNIGTATATIKGSTPTANAGYKFDHWQDSKGKTVDASWVDASNKLTPQKGADGTYAAETYTAVFVASTDVTYVIEYWVGDDTNANFSHNTAYKADERLTGTTGETVNAFTGTAPTITGFAYSAGHAGEVLSGTVAADGSLVLKLYYVRNQLQLEYTFTGNVPDGAANNLPATHTVGYDTTQTVPTGWENNYNGYRFEGWTASDGTTVVNVGGTFKMPNNNLTVTGKWVKLYTIHFEPNDGTAPKEFPATGSMADQNVVAGTAGDKLNKNTFAREGYTFMGWNLSQNGAGKAYADQNDLDDAFEQDIVAGSTVTLYAIWAPKEQDNNGTKYKVVYEEHGGTPVFDLPTASASKQEISRAVNWESNGFTTTYDAATENQIDPKKTGFKFLGWYLGTDTSSHKVEAGETYGHLVKLLGGTDQTTTLTLHALWEESNGYNVRYEENNNDDPNGVDVNDKTSVKWTDTGFDVTDPSAPTRMGYDFVGWFREPGLTTPVNSSDTYATLAGNDAQVTEVTLYAKWTPKHVSAPTNTPYKVIYEELNEPGDVDVFDLPNAKTPVTMVDWETSGFTTTYITDKDGNVVTGIPTKKGHNFIGWYIKGTNGELIAVKSTDTYGELTKLYGDITHDDTNWKLTLYAKWEAMTDFTIEYKPNIDPNVAAKITGTTPTRTNVPWNSVDLKPTDGTMGFKYPGYALDGYGWGYKKADGTLVPINERTGYWEVFNATETGGKKITLYAIWVSGNYKITYNANGGTLADGTTTKSQKATYDETGFVGKAPAYSTRTGYTVDAAQAWNTAADGTGTWLTDALTFEQLVGNSGKDEVVVYLIWKPITYTVHFVPNFNGYDATANHTMADQTLTYDKEEPLSSNNFYRPGWNFKGWFTNADGTGTHYSNQQKVINLASTQDAVVNLYAKWEQASGYTVEYKDGDDPAVDAAQKQTGLSWEQTGLDTPHARISKPGYDFAGWYRTRTVAPDGTVTLSDLLTANDPYSLLAGGDPNKMTVEVYAKWTAKAGYTVIYEENNNDDPNGTDVDDKSNVTWTQAGFNTTTPDAPTREGYTFAGWYKDQDLTQALDPTDTYAVLAGGNEAQTSVTIYAKWNVVNDYIIRYSVNGGTGAFDDRTVAWTTVGLDPVSGSATFAGKHLTGWAYKTPQGTYVATTPQSVYSTTYRAGEGANKVLVLYAMWDENTYTLVYNANGGSFAGGNNTTSVTVKFDQSGFATPAPMPTRKGYTLVVDMPYNSAQDGQGTKLTDAITYAALVNNNDQTLTTTVYAQWVPITYVVVFDANDGAYKPSVATGTMADQPMTYDVTAALTPNAYARKGYQFAGWNTKADGTGQSFGDKAQVVNLASTQDARVVLYARWTAANNYIVHYRDTDGSVFTPAIPDKTNATWTTTALYPATDPTKKGYQFKGWQYKDAAGKVYDAVAGTTAYSTLSDAIDPTKAQPEVTLYAVWAELIPYSVEWWQVDEAGQQYNTGRKVQNSDNVAYVEDNHVVRPETLNNSGKAWKDAVNLLGYFYNADATATANGGKASITVTKDGENILRLVYVRKNDYILIYDYNSAPKGGVAGKDQTTAYWKQQNLQNHTVPAKNAPKGYVLAGWNTKADGKGQNIDPTNEYGILTHKNYTDKNVTLTLYAVWKEDTSFTVHYLPNYDSNGVGDTTPIPQAAKPQDAGKQADKTGVAWNGTHLAAKKVTLVAPRGYHFAYWVYKLGNQEYKVEDTTAYSYIATKLNPNKVLKEITLYAKWEQNEVKIKYVTGIIDAAGTKGRSDAGGTVSRDSEVVRAAYGAALGAYSAAKPGYHFVRWERWIPGGKASAGAGLNVMPDTTTDSFFAPNQNTTDGVWYSETYIALFEQNEPAILHYDKNAEPATGVITDVTKPYGIPVKLDSGTDDQTPQTTDGFKWAHHTLKGWNTKADGTGTHYDLSYVGFVMPKGETTLYAEWTVNDGVLHYDKNATDATGTIADVKKPYGTQITTDSGTEDQTADTTDGFKRLHYVLVGWNTKPDYTGTHYGLSQVDAFGMPDGEMTLYAEWQKRKYGIEIPGVDGTDDPGAVDPTDPNSVDTDEPHTRVPGGVIIGGKPDEIEYGKPVPSDWVHVIPEGGKHLNGWDYTMVDEDGNVFTGHVDDPSQITVIGKLTLTPVFEDDKVEEPAAPAAPAAPAQPAAARGERLPQTSDDTNYLVPVALVGAALVFFLLALVSRRKKDDEE